MNVLRRFVAGCIHVALSIGAVLCFFSVMGVLFLFMHAIMGGVVHGLFINAKGTVGQLMDPGIPVVASFMMTEELARRFLAWLDR